jgi:hypothetical protein
MLIPGELISIITFPGVMIHEFAHKKFCDWTGINVHKVVYFQFKENEPAGYVLHEKPTKFRQIFAISNGPLVINSLFAMLFFTMAMFFGFLHWTISLLFLWLGASCGANAFPSSGDASVLWHGTKVHWRDNWLALIGFPSAILIWIANALSILWFDFIYAGSLYLLTGYILVALLG